MKDPKLMSEVEQSLEEGKVHTKTDEEREQEIKELEERKQNAYLSTLLLLTATFHQLEELAELGATQKRTKQLVNKTIKSMEQDLESIFDLGESSTDKKIDDLELSKEEKKKAKKEQHFQLGKYVEDGALQLRSLVKKYVSE